MERRFIVDTPDTLRGLEPFVKEGRVSRVASVWNAARRNGGRCAWDGRIEILFSTESGKRTAQAVRQTEKDGLIEFAKLKYAQALDWCKLNLPEEK